MAAVSRGDHAAHHNAQLTQRVHGLHIEQELATLTSQLSESKLREEELEEKRTKMLALLQSP